ncbi:oxysterol-binding protein-related [Holotrichia oblita]|uniref:Oxysterol-binding protein-related n=1 Tax=Holotrichia oblita TaxID=644536 RepID=A0ACB9TJC4_HOLOL|nr:oxysterol-binding protein-related [Holotrichia oblita]
MNDNYSFEELADMHLVYGAAQCNGKEAARLYEQRYPARRQPHHTTFASIHRRLRESGNLKRLGGSGRPRTACTVQFEEKVLHRVEENQFTSVRAIAHHMGSSKSTVHRVIHEQLLYSFIYNALKRLLCGHMFIKQRCSFCCPLSSLKEVEEFINVQHLNVVKKRVQPIIQQQENESRKLWKEVTAGLKFNDIDHATNAKASLEQKQRDEAKYRKDTNTQWETKLFNKEVDDSWTYVKPLRQRLNPSSNT